MLENERLMTFYRYPALDSVVELAVKALDKQDAKKPKSKKVQNIKYVTNIYKCPCCDKCLSRIGMENYCCNCGQALDWSEKWK